MADHFTVDEFNEFRVDFPEISHIQFNFHLRNFYILQCSSPTFESATLKFHNQQTNK